LKTKKNKKNLNFFKIFLKHKNKLEESVTPLLLPNQTKVILTKTHSLKPLHGLSSRKPLGIENLK
jgi:hypothetical protein